MSNSVNTPELSRCKKRDLSSPEDLLLPKKNKFIAHSPDTFDCLLSASVLNMDSPTTPPPTTLSLDEGAIQAIAQTLKSSIQEQLNAMLTATVESVVKNIFSNLTSEINTLKSENEALRSENADLMYRVETLEFQADASEQYSRRDSVRISGIAESANENTDDLILDLCTAMEASITINDLAVSHRVGKRNSSSKPRDILVKFVSRRSRNLFYKKRTLLKDKGYKGTFINEDLTKYRSELLYEARKLVKSNNILSAWSSDGMILIKARKDKKNSVHKILCKRDIAPFTSYSITD